MILKNPLYFFTLKKKKKDVISFSKKKTLLEILSNLCALHYPRAPLVFFFFFLTLKNLIQEEDCLQLQTMPAVGQVQPDPYRGG